MVFNINDYEENIMYFLGYYNISYNKISIVKFYKKEISNTILVNYLTKYRYKLKENVYYTDIYYTEIDTKLEIMDWLNKKC